MRPAQMSNVATMGAAAPTTYDLTSYYAAMSVEPDAARKTLLQALADGLLTDGVLSLLDGLYIIAAHDAQAARVNMKNASVATLSGSATFTTDRGYFGDGVSGGLDTGIADNAAGNWSRNAGSFGLWVNLAPSTGGTAMGLTTGAATRYQPQVAGAPIGRMHAATNVTGATASSLGATTFVRTDSTTLRCDQNGVAGTPGTTTAAIATTADTFQIMRGGGSFSDAHIGGAWWGGALTTGQSLALYNRLNTYLTAIGGA